MSRYKHFSLFADGRKVADMQTTEITVESGDTLEITDGGVHATDGTSMGTLSCKTLVPVKGTGFHFTEKALRHTDLKISAGVVDGTIMQFDARVKSVKFSSDVAKGVQNGDFEFLLFNTQVTG